MSKKTNVMQFAGAWKKVLDSDTKKIKRNIKILRKKATEDLLKQFQ